MDIRQAKEELRRTVLAYTARTEAGTYRIAPVRQRPVLLMGPPGVGKTAILEQIARELDIGLVAYTMTHHTRQSALGLPVIREKTYGRRQYQATEYTMSEIVAAVYEHMEQRGCREGILFLDEINCVSETVMPAMLQLLQNKQFGVHRLPEGWVIVAAGNPPRYNQAARNLDTVTLDRVKRMDIEPDFLVWRDYALERQLHGAIISYLSLHPEHFYTVEKGGAQFVTARGWEDLSETLLSYEALGFPCGQSLFVQYLQHESIAADFAVFYELYMGYRAKLPLEEVLSGQWSGEAEALRALPFEGRLAVLQFLLHALHRRCTALAEEESFALSFASFAAADTGAANYLAAARQRLERREQATALRKDCGALSPAEEERESLFIREMHQQLNALEVTGQDGSTAAECLAAAAAARQLKAQEETADLAAAMENSLGFVRSTFGAEQELLIFLTQLTAVSRTERFLCRHCAELYESLCEEVLPERAAARLRGELRG